MVVIDPTTKEITPLVERFEGKRLNNPNELYIDASGAIWFSDPAYDRKPEELEVPSEAVYWISPDRQTVKRVAEGFKRPNGVLGTPDGKFLYISDRMAGETWIYPILGPGELGEIVPRHEPPPRGVAHRGETPGIDPPAYGVVAHAEQGGGLSDPKLRHGQTVRHLG